MVGRLFDHYFEINAGIGAHKSPELYGAFPTDPYSYTPGGKGAQQPGMTGMAEDLLAALVNPAFGFKGQFQLTAPSCTLKNFTEPAVFETLMWQDKRKPELAATLVYTVCQAVHQRGEQEGIEMTWNDGRTTHIDGLALDHETSRKIFRRLHEVVRLTVTA